MRSGINLQDQTHTNLARMVALLENFGSIKRSSANYMFIPTANEEKNEKEKTVQPCITDTVSSKGHIYSVLMHVFDRAHG